ncbi:nucleotide exchange factor GrpE [Eubacteriaceae bacterium ES3]|nr:nucleotide exchange factor GrpE [Eubacteriaceae bacterium ES3]
MASEEQKNEEVMEEEIVSEKSEEEISPEEAVEEEIETVKEVAEEAKKEDEDVINRLLRLQADFENYKKRTQKEKTEISQFAAERFATKLLPVLDNLERAQASFKDSTDEAKTYADGVQMVFKQLMAVLTEEGLEEVDCDCSFDPNCHHGVATEDHPDREDQDILEVFQKGYTFKGKLIRPAMVKICSK